MSVMIGTALTTNQMTTVSLPTLENRWSRMNADEWNRSCDTWERWISLGLVLMVDLLCAGFGYLCRARSTNTDLPAQLAGLNAKKVPDERSNLAQLFATLKAEQATQSTRVDSSAVQQTGGE